MSRMEPEDVRRRQLIETTIETMADAGFIGTTLGQIARRAGVSPGLVAHYFGDKDGLLEATLRHLARRVGRRAAASLAAAKSPRARVQAVIDANLAPEEFDRQTCTVWLAFWGQVIHSPRLKRIQHVYQQRMLSNLRHPLKELLPSHQAERLALAIAAVIDGLWLRATLSGSGETDSVTARAIATGFVDSQLAGPYRPRGEDRLPDAGAAVARAQQALLDGGCGSPRDRARILFTAASRLRADSPGLGLPEGEAGAAIDLLEQGAELALRLPDLGPSRPLGVLAGADFGRRPFYQACRHAALALAGGNALIHLAEPAGAPQACRLIEALEAAGLAPGLCAVAAGNQRRLNRLPGLAARLAPPGAIALVLLDEAARAERDAAAAHLTARGDGAGLILCDRLEDLEAQAGLAMIGLYGGERRALARLGPGLPAPLVWCGGPPPSGPPLGLGEVAALTRPFHFHAPAEAGAILEVRS